MYIHLLEETNCVISEKKISSKEEINFLENKKKKLKGKKIIKRK